MCVDTVVFQAVSCMTVSTENATSPIFTKSRNSHFWVSRGTNSNGDFGSIENCTEEFEFLGSVDFGGVAISVEAVTGFYVVHNGV